MTSAGEAGEQAARRLPDPTSLAHHAGKRAFGWLRDVAKHPLSHVACSRAWGPDDACSHQAHRGTDDEDECERQHHLLPPQRAGHPDPDCGNRRGSFR